MEPLLNSNSACPAIPMDPVHKEGAAERTSSTACFDAPTLAFPIRLMTPVFCSEPTVTRVGAVRPPLPISSRPVLSSAPVTVSELPPEGLSPELVWVSMSMTAVPSDVLRLERLPAMLS